MFPKSRKLTPELEREVLEKVADGWSSRRVSKWLAAERAVKISHVSIGKYLERVRTERAVQVKAVVREKLAGTIIPDLDALARETQRVRRLCLLLYNKTKTASDELLIGLARAYLASAEQHRKAVETTMRLSGADTPDEVAPELAEAAKRVAGRMARLTAASGARGHPAEASGAGLGA